MKQEIKSCIAISRWSVLLILRGKVKTRQTQ